jgi:hypothetical protein
MMRDLEAIAEIASIHNAVSVQMCVHDEIWFVLPKENKVELDKIQIEACARAGHEVNRAFSIAQGDNSHPSWDEVSAEDRRTVINGVLGLLHQNLTDEQSHAAWVAFMTLDGWTSGSVKNRANKVHHCLVDYSKLNPDDRKKNELFCMTVRAVAKAIWAIPRQ